MPMQHPLADTRKVGLSIVAKRDEFSVEHGPYRQPREKVELGAMFQPRRLRPRSGPPVETMARNPSHLTSYAQGPRAGRRPERASIGSGSALYSTAAVGKPYPGTSVSSALRE
jgi:hypothetical protein